MPDLLVHACCAPCFVAPYQHMQAEGEYNITAFWYNPNIHPYTEYDLRLNTVIEFCQQQDIPLILQDDYDLELFLRQSAWREEHRCAPCYDIRLAATAAAAAKHGFDHFTSTLLYSRYQSHEIITKVATARAKEFNTNFYYRDFRPLWQEGIDLSKQMQMYRQKYCGCIYSERDRWEKKLHKKRQQLLDTK